MDSFLTMPLLWLFIGLILLIAEIFTPGFVLALIGVAAILTSGVSLIFKNTYIQLFTFGIFLIVLAVFVRPIFIKFFFKSDKKSAVDALIGRESFVNEEINSQKGTGYIKIGADYLKAVSSDNRIIPKGTLVKIDSLLGITATVSIVDNNNIDKNSDNNDSNSDKKNEGILS